MSHLPDPRLQTDPAATRMIDTLCDIYRGKPVIR